MVFPIYSSTKKENLQIKLAEPPAFFGSVTPSGLVLSFRDRIQASACLVPFLVPAPWAPFSLPLPTFCFHVMRAQGPAPRDELRLRSIDPTVQYHGRGKGYLTLPQPCSQTQFCQRSPLWEGELEVMLGMDSAVNKKKHFISPLDTIP